jgi:hypothetical protein
LAWESSGDDINGNAICPETLSGNTSHVVVDGCAWPMLGKDGAAVGFDLAERDGSHPGSFEAEREAANS